MHQRRQRQEKTECFLPILAVILWLEIWSIVIAKLFFHAYGQVPLFCGCSIPVFMLTSSSAKSKPVGKIDSFVFSPEDIALKDDAFHRSKALHFTEWWYFDATLENGYSVQLSVRVLSALKQGLVFLRVDIYKDGHVVSHERKTYLMSNVNFSCEAPLIEIAGKQVMRGYIDKNTGNWIYDLSFVIKNTSAELQFIGCTKGWKGKLRGGDWWGVILPRAEVKGRITVNSKILEIAGIGYHDHNWEVKVFAVMNVGWFWGKVNSESYTMTWATILQTRLLSNPLIIVNTKNQGYLNVDPKRIRFTAEDFRKDRGKLVPHLFTLDAHNEMISFHVTMEVLKIHHVRIMLIMNYWRYHVKCIGSITVDSKEETIDETHIAEFVRFR